MKVSTIKEELNSLAYHGRGIIIGKSPDGKKAITAYFIMGRSVNSRNRVFVPEGHARCQYPQYSEGKVPSHKEYMKPEPTSLLQETTD